MPSMNDLLRAAASLGASDLHLSAGEAPCLRVSGDLVRMEGQPVLSPEGVIELVYSIMSPEQKARFEQEHDIDFACELEGSGRFRVNVFVQRRGPGAVLRTIPTQIPTLEGLGMPAILQELCTRERGLVLVTGPTGSGKSTTLAAMVDLINRTWDAHILTVEDPIEFVHTSKRCLVNQRTRSGARCARTRT
jgi:twitching motility protein PilT